MIKHLMVVSFILLTLLIIVHTIQLVISKKKIGRIILLTSVNSFNSYWFSGVMNFFCLIIWFLLYHKYSFTTAYLLLIFLFFENSISFFIEGYIKRNQGIAECGIITSAHIYRWKNILSYNRVNNNIQLIINENFLICKHCRKIIWIIDDSSTVDEVEYLIRKNLQNIR